MNVPQRPSRAPEEPTRGGSWVAVLLTLVIALTAIVGLIFLTLGQFGLVVIVGGGIFAVALFHYVVWGWWLGAMIRQEHEEAEEH